MHASGRLDLFPFEAWLPIKGSTDKLLLVRIGGPCIKPQGSQLVSMAAYNLLENARLEGIDLPSFEVNVVLPDDRYQLVQLRRSGKAGEFLAKHELAQHLATILATRNTHQDGTFIWLKRAVSDI